MNQWGSAPKRDGCTRVEVGGGWVERGEREIEERKRERKRGGRNAINDANETRTHEENAQGKEKEKEYKREGGRNVVRGTSKWMDRGSGGQGCMARTMKRDAYDTGRNGRIRGEEG